jgi:hypothetical protein
MSDKRVSRLLQGDHRAVAGILRFREQRMDRRQMVIVCVYVV